MGLDAEINWAVQNWPNQHTHNTLILVGKKRKNTTGVKKNQEKQQREHKKQSFLHGSPEFYNLGFASSITVTLALQVPGVGTPHTPWTRVT